MTAAQVRVCVIGAGAAGLCAARHLASKNNLIPTVFEQSDVVGGTWVYNEQVGADSHNNPIHSSMYKSMRTNLPKEVMAFPDFPFPSTNHSFLHHTEVRAYLDKYTDHFDVRKYIRFNTSIRHVSPVNNSAGWMITVENLSTGETTTSNFEAVVVCNGHYSVPNIPDDLIGLDTFRGLKMHSHDYRHPGLFEGKSVIVLGAAASGLDIGLEVASTAKKVYLSHNGPPHPSELPGNMVQVAGVTEVIEPHDGGVLLSDGSTVKDVDVILFCTGYHYSFPFLDKRCGLQIENRTVTPLYKHMFHISFPTLCFIGIPIQICPFPQFDLQVQLFAKTLTGELRLPPTEAMQEDTLMEKTHQLQSGVAERHFHKMGPKQWDYNRSLVKLAKLREVPLAVERLYNDVHAWRTLNLTTYKNDSYALDGDSYKRST